MQVIKGNFCPQTFSLGKLLELRIAEEENMSFEEIALALECTEEGLWAILLGNIEFGGIPRNILENCAAFLAISIAYLYVKVGVLPLSDFKVKGQSKFNHPELHNSFCELLACVAVEDSKKLNFQKGL